METKQRREFEGSQVPALRLTQFIRTGRMMSEIISLTRLHAADDTQQWSGEVRLSHGAEIGRKIINDPRQGD